MKAVQRFGDVTISATSSRLHERNPAYEDGAPELPDLSAIDFDELDEEQRAQYLQLQEEVEYYRRENIKQRLREVPMEKECHQYRFKQTEEEIFVDIPIPYPVKPEDMILVLTEDQFMLQLKNHPDYPEIIGNLMGKLLTEHSSFSIVPAVDDRGGYLVRLEARKAGGPGAYALWYGFLEGETAAPTVRYRGNCRRYSWAQNCDYVEVEVPIPGDVTKKGTFYQLDPAGKSMKLAFDVFPQFGVLEGKFGGTISVIDSMWVIDGNDEGTKLYLSLKKKRKKDDVPEWWSTMIVGEEYIPEE